MNLTTPARRGGGRAPSARAPGPLPAILLGLVCGTACPGAVAGHAGEEAYRELLQSLPQGAIEPVLQRFTQRARAFTEAAGAFCALASPGTLEAARGAWREASSAWMGVESLVFGPAVEDNLDLRVHFWPVRRGKINKLIQSGKAITAARLAFYSVAGKGLAAAEFLLFDIQRDTAQMLADFDVTHPMAARRCDYLRAIADRLHANAVTLSEAWSPQGENFGAEFAGAGGADSEQFMHAHDAVGALVGAMVSLLERVAVIKIAKPLGKKSRGVAKPFKTEAWRSGHSLRNIVANLQGVLTLFRGGGAKDAYGFDDYLRARGEGALADAVEARLGNAIAAVQRIPEPLREALKSNPSSVEEGLNGVQSAVVLLKTEFARAMGVHIGFNAADGD